VQDVQISRSYQNVLPAVRFNYDFSTSRHLRFDYETSVQEPTIQQLQPVVDNSDPLNLYVGNTALRPAYVQSWRLNYMTFDQVTFVSFFVFANIDYTTNALTTAQYIDQNLVRTSTPVNVDNNLSMSGNASFMFPVTKLKSRFTVGSTYRNQRSINLLNDVANTIHQETAAGNLRYNFRYNDIFDLSLTANKNYQLTRYEFEQPQQTFINSTYTAESNLTLLKNYQLNAELEYLEYENRSTSFSQAIPLLDLAISRFILKNKSGEIKFSVNNLLDKALGINQTASSNYLERETINSLGRYFMVSFTYALNKQLNPMGMRRGPGGPMIRINRGG
jgi:outer membrane receptor protein involved in Fe transport